MLHIVNKSPFQTRSLESCLRMAKPGSAVLLIEDAVVAATTGTTAEASVRAACAQVKVYALQPDLEARGLNTRVIEGVNLVDYGGFVDLTLEHNTTQSWL